MRKLRQRAERGQGAVELALIALILLNLLIGVIEAARLGAVYISILNAAREGARAGAVPGASDATIENAVNGTVLSFGNAVSTTICPTTVGGSSSSCTPLSGSVTRNSGGALAVTVTCTFNFFPPVSVVAPGGLSLSSTAVTQIG